MNTLRANRRRPARPAAVVMAVALILGLQVLGTSGVPTANAADPAPTAEPSPAPLPSPDPTVDPTAEPTAEPTPPDPTPDPTADSGATPDPTTAPDPSPTPDPGATIDPFPTPDAGPPAPTIDPSAAPASPEPTPTPMPWSLSGGQQGGRDAPAPIPLWKLKAPANAAASTAIHTVVGLTSSDCAACHATHAGASQYLLNEPAPGSTLCLRCHSGSGSPYDVGSQLNGVPSNDPATDSYYSHLIEAGAARKATCAECHNPHDANDSRPAMSTRGWTASGDIRAATGVAVTNGPAGSAPAYTPITRSSGGASLTFEYELCLACHSGATTLLDATAAHPSWWALDKGVELNPANASYHPIEAAGRNRSTQMAASLAGTSPFKAWDYTIDSTVRCTSCHGDPSTVNQLPNASPKRPNPNAQEAPHASANRGLLIAPYRDRELKAEGQAYDPTDFALCYLCHAEAAFVDPNYDPSSPSTAFSLHGLHLVNLPGTPDGGTSIDRRGDGEGLAICAECHFRIHSTAIAYRPGDTVPTARANGSAGLVNFAPNVAGLGTNPPTWNQPGSAGTGTCALTCHGFTHLASDPFVSYETAPGTGFSASPTSGPVGALGLPVQFSDETRYASSGGATWAWDFGDGTTSILRDPEHTYLVPGTYTVSLTVTRTSDGLFATMTRQAYITVVP